MRRWSELSQVERVEVYTRQSLYGALWLSVGFLIVSAANQQEGEGTAFAVAALGAAVLAGLATLVVHDLLDLYPATRPLPWRSIVPLLLGSSAAVALALPQPDGVRGTVVMSVLFALGWGLGGVSDDRVAAALVLGLGALMALTSGEPLAFLGGAAAAAFFVFTLRVSLWLVGVVTELDTGRTAQAALAVAEERLRFSRDVHDVLGRRLSAIAMQAELAASLARRGDPDAADRMLAVRGVAHEALREARELARGYRATDLTQELEGARSLLRSAGIEVRLDVAGVPDAWQEPAAWVVREAVTNVLRHSTARRVDIVFVSPELVVADDGPVGAEPGPGSGIDGLRERLAPHGATVTTSSGPDGFRLTARFDVPQEGA